MPRCGATIVDDATATFTMIETRSEGGVWHTDFTVKVDANGVIKSGTTDVYGVDPPTPARSGQLHRGRHPPAPSPGTDGKNYVTPPCQRSFRIDGYTITNVAMDGASAA